MATGVEMEMNELLSALFGIMPLLIAGLMIMLLPVYFYRLYLLFKKLKKLETQEWNRLGSPTLIINHTLRNELCSFLVYGLSSEVVYPVL